MRHFKPISSAAFILILCINTSAWALDSNQAQVQQFIDKMAHDHAYDRTQLNDIFKRTQLRPKILELLDRPAEKLEWHQYRPIFLKEGRIKQGVIFWEANAAVLDQAEKKFGVAKETIVAIIGVETYYGRHRGKHSVVDALSTIGFSDHRRQAFFLSELEHVLLLAREEQTDALQLKGSYAGAMGIPQFIASSFRNYAIDFDDDGKRDLWNNPADAIGSVANYLSVHRWQRDAPIANVVVSDPSTLAPFIENGLKPTIELSELRRAGVRTVNARRVPTDESTLTSVIVLKNKTEKIYVETYQNFYAITRYNHSPLYAMAVVQLGEAIATRKANH